MYDFLWGVATGIVISLVTFIVWYDMHAPNKKGS
jgi:hypothetical protein